MVAHTWDPSIQWAEARELQFKTSLGYKVMPSLNKANQTKLQDAVAQGKAFV